MISLNKRFVRQPAQLVTIVIMCVVIVGTFSCSKNSNNYFYHTGDIVKENLLQFPGMKENFLQPGFFHVILFTDSIEKDYALLKFVNNLYSSKYKTAGCRLVLITNKVDDQENENLEKSKVNINLDFPVLFLENENTLNDMKMFFDPATTGKALIIIDPNFKLEAIFYFWQEDDFRQLMEKYLVGKISYSGDSEQELLKKGDLFPGFSISSLSTTGQPYQYKTNHERFTPFTWFVFKSNCISCALNKHLKQYQSLENKLAKKLKSPYALLFSPYFLEDEILERLSFFKIKTTTYLAEDELLGIENKFFKENPGPSSTLVIMTDHDNKITYLATMQDFAADLDGGKFDNAIHSN